MASRPKLDFVPVDKTLHTKFAKMSYLLNIVTS